MNFDSWTEFKDYMREVALNELIEEGRNVPSSSFEYQKGDESLSNK